MLDKECRCCPGILKLLLQRLRTLLALCCVLWLVSISWGTGIQADARCFPQVRVQRVELCLLHVKLHMRCHVSRSMAFQSMLEVLCTRCAHWSHWYYGRGQGTHLIENVFRHFVISMSAVIITHTSYSCCSRHSCTRVLLPPATVDFPPTPRRPVSEASEYRQCRQARSWMCMTCQSAQGLALSASILLPAPLSLAHVPRPRASWLLSWASPPCRDRLRKEGKKKGVGSEIEGGRGRGRRMEGMGQEPRVPRER